MTMKILEPISLTNDSLTLSEKHLDTRTRHITFVRLVLLKINSLIQLSDSIMMLL